MEKKDISKIYPDRHSIEHLTFVFSQAEKKLEDTYKSFEYTSNKNVILISAIVAVMSAISAFFITNLDFNGVFSPIVTTSFFSIIYLFVLLVRIGNNIKSKKYIPCGSQPELLFTERPEKITEELHYKDILHSEIVNYSKRINFNSEINEKRTTITDSCIKYLILFPLISIFFHLIIYFLNSYFLYF